MLGVRTLDFEPCRLSLGHVLDCIHFMTLIYFTIIFYYFYCIYIFYKLYFTPSLLVLSTLNGNYIIIFLWSKNVTLLALIVLF